MLCSTLCVRFVSTMQALICKTRFCAGKPLFGRARFVRSRRLLVHADRERVQRRPDRSRSRLPHARSSPADVNRTRRVTRVSPGCGA